MSFQSNPGHPSFHMVTLPDSACNLVKDISSSLLDTAEVGVEHCGSTVGSLSGNISPVQLHMIQERLCSLVWHGIQSNRASPSAVLASVSLLGSLHDGCTSTNLTAWLVITQSLRHVGNQIIQWLSRKSVHYAEWSLSPTSHQIVGDIKAERVTERVKKTK